MVMTTSQEAGLKEQEVPQISVPEVEIRGSYAVIYLRAPDAATQREVKLPKTIWG
jgi:hypothetical protein